MNFGGPTRRNFMQSWSTHPMRRIGAGACLCGLELGGTARRSDREREPLRRIGRFGCGHRSTGPPQRNELIEDHRLHRSAEGSLCNIPRKSAWKRRGNSACCRTRNTTTRSGTAFACSPDAVKRSRRSMRRRGCSGRNGNDWFEHPGDRPASRQVECVFDFPWFLGHAQEHAP